MHNYQTLSPKNGESAVLPLFVSGFLKLHTNTFCSPCPCAKTQDLHVACETPSASPFHIFHTAPAGAVGGVILHTVLVSRSVMAVS